jgi:hypothetical protein
MINLLERGAGWEMEEHDQTRLSLAIRPISPGYLNNG